MCVCACERKKERESRPNLPEPLDLFAVPGVVAIDCVLLPFSDVELLHPTQHQLQLSLVEELEPVKRNHFVESVQEGLRLLLNSSFEPPLGH